MAYPEAAWERGMKGRAAGIAAGASRGLVSAILYRPAGHDSTTSPWGLLDLVWRASPRSVSRGAADS
jgi:hypothetical protein